MKTWMVRVLTRCLLVLRQFLSWLHRRARRRWSHTGGQASPFRRVFASPKPRWVKNEVIRLKALMPQAGCRTIAHHFNRRWKRTRQMTVGESYVAGTLKKHH